MGHIREKISRKYEVICGIWDWCHKNPDVIKDPYEFIFPYDPIEVRRRKPRAEERETEARHRREEEEEEIEMERLEREEELERLEKEREEKNNEG